MTFFSSREVPEQLQGSREVHRSEARFPVRVVSVACLAFLEVGGWRQSELKSAAADPTISLLWAALPLVSKMALPRGTAPSSPSRLSKQVRSIRTVRFRRGYRKPKHFRFAKVPLLREERCRSATSVPRDFSGWGQVWGLPGAPRELCPRSADKRTWFWPVLWLQMRPTVSLAQIRPLQDGRQWLGRFLCFVCSPF